MKLKLGKYVPYTIPIVISSLLIYMSRNVDERFSREVYLHQSKRLKIPFIYLPQYIEFGHGGYERSKGYGVEGENARDLDNDGINDCYIVCVDGDTIARLSSMNEPESHYWFDLGKPENRDSD